MTVEFHYFLNIENNIDKKEKKRENCVLVRSFHKLIEPY